MRLGEQEFLEVIKRAPLVSIDLIITDRVNHVGRILMGRRVNEPAKGKWFVPGGRIYKHENLDQAFGRICLAEIGQTFSRADARLVGVFTHQYDTNFLLVPDVTTHYVVLAYELCATKVLQPPAGIQHSEFKWLGPANSGVDIHAYSVEYFRHLSWMDEPQYSVLNSRRDSFNSLLWQTPVLSLTAQAFLFTIILSADSATTGRLVASLLAFVTAVVSVQLLAKHRFMEKRHAELLAQHERTLGRFEVNSEDSFKSNVRYIQQSSYRLWMLALVAFAISAAGYCCLLTFRLISGS